MILSLLHLILTIRAFLRSLTERFAIGIVGGVVRGALMFAMAILGLKRASLFMLPGITLQTAPTESSQAAVWATLIGTVLGPITSFAVLGGAWRRYQDVPPAQEEKLQRPFMAWLPVALLDAIYLVILVAGIWFMRAD